MLVYKYSIIILMKLKRLYMVGHVTVIYCSCSEDGFAVRSLWVGNVNPERVTESHIAELFGK